MYATIYWRPYFCTCLQHKLRLFCHQWPSIIPWRKPRKPSWRLPQTSSIQLLFLPYLYDKPKSTYRHSTCTNTLAFQLSPWDLGETGGRFTSHNFLRFYPSFHATCFKVQTKKSNQCLLLKANPHWKTKVLLVKLFFQTKFTSRSYSGLISGGGEVHKGGCYMHSREGFQLQVDLDKNALGDSVDGHQKFGEKTSWGW